MSFVASSLFENLQLNLECSERREELVRGVGNEAFLRGQRPFQTRHQVVHRGRCRSELDRQPKRAEHRAASANHADRARRRATRRKNGAS
jgi:hypothetical protein